MSNLSQFFALGGNKIKSIQTVTANQIISGSVRWSGVASISAVDPSKTLLICSPSNNSLIIYSATGDYAAGVSNTGHGAYLIGTDQIAFQGPQIDDYSGSSFQSIRIGARMVVQVVEFE